MLSKKERKRSDIVWLTLIAVLCCGQLKAQITGCTDPLASNFNELATENDGTCLYAPISIFPTTISDPMSPILVETSGLLFFNGSLWSMNDSDNRPEFYEVDPNTGTVLKTVTVANANLVDWESMASDGTHLYMADVGNNLGNRTDLGIYKIPWSPVLQASGDTVIIPEFIGYSYPDQTDFSSHFHDNDYDCEAVIFYRDSLHLFSKNWVDNKTRHYRVSTDPGMQVATLLDSFNVEGLITGATVRETADIIMLLGYTESFQTFIYLLSDYPEGRPLHGNKRRLNMPDNAFQQVEGIAFDDSLSVFFTREMTSVNGGPSLYHVEVTTVLYPESVAIENGSESRVFRTNETISFQLEKNFTGKLRIEIVDLTGEILYEKDGQFEQGRMELKDLWTSQLIVVSILIENERMVFKIPPQF